MPAYKLHTQIDSVESELAEIGLNRSKLIDAVKRAGTARFLCTAHDRPGFEPITMNGKAIREIRDEFVGEDWEACEMDNQSGIINKRLRVRVIHCNFDENAGSSDPDIIPENLRGKGTASGKKVRCNRTPCIPGLEPRLGEEPSSDIRTYVLGTYCDDESYSIRAELSLPNEFEKGIYTNYETRIILMDGSEDSLLPYELAPQDNLPTEEIDIPVSRK